MSRGGAREGSGRKPGQPNKIVRERNQKIMSTGITPLDYMIEILRDQAAEVSVRLDAAKAAAPYIHSKMPTAIVSPPPASPMLTEEDDDLLNTYLNGIHAEADEG